MGRSFLFCQLVVHESAVETPSDQFQPASRRHEALAAYA